MTSADRPKQVVLAAVPDCLEITQLKVDPRTTLLDSIRETVGLTGTKKGCDHRQCGACTVLVNGRPLLSCLNMALMHDGNEITTIEGLGTPEALHPTASQLRVPVRLFGRLRLFSVDYFRVDG